MYHYSFWKDAFERAGKTVAQALITLGLFGPLTNALDIDVKQTFGVCASVAVLSILTSIASTQVGTSGTASLTTEATICPTEPATDGSGI